MIEYLVIGILAGAVGVLGYDKYRKRNKSGSESLSEEEIRRVKELDEHFTKMLNYDTDAAYKINRNKED